MTNLVFDRQMMRRCIELAASAKESGHSPVGCVITIEIEMIAEAGELCPGGSDPFAHAEILAVAAAMRVTGAERLPGATLYTTKRAVFSLLVLHSRGSDWPRSLFD